MGRAIPDSEGTACLLKQAKAGDQRAIEELLARHRAYLREIIALRLDSRLRPRVDASDVVQETELEVFRRLADYIQRQPMPFRLWLRKTACERLLNLREHHVDAERRSLWREVPLPERSSLMLAQRLGSGGSTPSQRMSRRERARLVNQALSQLTQTDREILLMREFEGLSYDEVACTLGIEPAAARKRYGRALLRLQQLLVAHGVLDSRS
jgi:RNA polymerase sigma-70 factor (ECF subfamily)